MRQSSEASTSGPTQQRFGPELLAVVRRSALEPRLTCLLEPTLLLSEPLGRARRLIERREGRFLGVLKPGVPG
eukprot:566504-Rhodomonas_salina.1